MAAPQQNDNTNMQVGSLLNTTLQNLVVAVNNCTQALLSIFPRTMGSFTLAAAASTVVPSPQIKANSIVQLFPTNASAAALAGAGKALYYTINPGVGFTVFTANGVAAAGTEGFSYAIVTPA